MSSTQWKKHYHLVNCCSDDGYGYTHFRTPGDSNYDHIRRWTDVIATRLDSIIIDDLPRTTASVGREDEVFLLDDALGTVYKKLEDVTHLLASLRNELKH
jgi:hypothetical protein